MLAQEADNLDELRYKFFVEELSLRPEEIPEAERNLVGIYEVLFRISERTNRKII